MKIDDVLNYKIGIIGLGVLGSAIAECFINKKIKIIGYDLSNKFYKKLNTNNACGAFFAALRDKFSICNHVKI